MQQRWCPCPLLRVEPVDGHSPSTETRDHLRVRSQEFVSLAYALRGDYTLNHDAGVEFVRLFQSADGAVLGRINDAHAKWPFEFASILADGTYVRSIPTGPVAPWNCCRFPVHVIFGPECSVEGLLVRHLDALAELELGCGRTNRYQPHRLEEVVTYLHELVHETVYALHAPSELLAIPEPMHEEQLLSI